MKCPTCQDAKEDCCCSCESEIDSKQQELMANPFAAEINDDYSLHLLCDECLTVSRDSV